MRNDRKGLKMGLFGNRGDKKPKMSRKEFNSFLKSCYEELKAKQDALINDYSLAEYEDFWLDLEKRTLQFKKDGKVGLEFRILPIGSWSDKSKSWMWVWANETADEELRGEASVFKELADITNNKLFEIGHISAREAIAHELSSMAIHHIGAIALYIAPADEVKTFLALIEKV